MAAPTPRFPISNPDKIFWPEEGYTKRDLVLFYDHLFEKLRPWVKDRLLSLERCPDGIRRECFFQKQAPPGLPNGTPIKPIRHKNRVTRYVVGGRRDTQLALANLGCIAVHVWGSRAASPRKPDWLCFDLDPGSGGFADAARAGLIVHEALEQLHLTSYAKTSGGKGMHIFVPIRVGPDADEVASFARQIAKRLVDEHPDLLTVEFSIAKRGGRVYLDSGRNGYAQTVVTPYSLRAQPHAPVSTPLRWDEVSPSLRPEKFNIGNFQARLEIADPWKDFWKQRQALPKL